MLPAARLLGFAAAATLVTATTPAMADADSLVDNLGPREVGTGEAMRAGATGAAAANLNPAGLPLTNEVVFEGGYGYRPDDSASVVSLAACDSTNPLPGCFYYSYVSADQMLEDAAMQRRTHLAGLTLSKVVSEKIIVGAGVKYFDHESDAMPDDNNSGVNWDLGATVRLTDVVNLAVVGYNLWGAESPQFPRAVAAGVMAHPVRSLTANFDAVWNLDPVDGSDTGRYGGGLEYFVSTQRGQVGYPVRLGALHDVALDSTYMTAGLGVASMKVGLDIGARRQVKDGDELLITASVRFYGPRQAAGAPAW
jgi:hypothetical protein